jgi:hypothetical protein
MSATQKQEMMKARMLMRVKPPNDKSSATAGPMRHLSAEE